MKLHFNGCPSREDAQRLNQHVVLTLHGEQFSIIIDFAGYLHCYNEDELSDGEVPFEVYNYTHDWDVITGTTCFSSGREADACPNKFGFPTIGTARWNVDFTPILDAIEDWIKRMKD